jgi:acyl-CoA synthetase (AMP-forming)/AMP-acid ligase II/aryl carrier-like protein
MVGFDTAFAPVLAWAEKAPRSVAIAAPGLPDLYYDEFAADITDIGAALRSLGVQRNDVVGIVLPNGPEAATAFVGVAAAATAAPLNPGYREPEFEFYMTDLGMKAVIVPAGEYGPAVTVAEAHGIDVIRLERITSAGAGSFRLLGATDEGSFDDPARPDDIALILHTSGTTSRPKMVRLTHRNLAASARNIAATLQLTSSDGCLNVMPLFHIHGLMAAVLASMSAGSAVICTPGFVATDFFGWLGQCRPTWYTAVPTMHQAILERAGDATEVISETPLRFVRSSSSSLAPQLMASLEETFGVPVVEAYGMTEAAHQMASNPLPPEERKPGSVGRSDGPEVAIMDDAANLLPTGVEGEIVIRGDNVFAGYAANSEANAVAFDNGWFRTGDLGRLDPEGYLFISGRLKEIINRGGETISPREIDEALLDHPAVSAALAFAVPDRRLGEQVAAAVVIEPGASVNERDLRNFASVRIAPFKVPRRIVFLDEIPKGPTGKLQRIGLADRLGLDELEGKQEELPATPPSSAVEVLLADLWSDVLGVEEIAVHDRFLDVGGDSMLAMRLLARVRDTLDLDFTVIDFFDHATIAGQAVLVEDRLLEVGNG